MANHESVKRRDQKPPGRNFPGGKEDSESKETSTSLVKGGKRGVAFRVDVIATGKQTAERTGLKKNTPAVHGQ